MIAAFFLSLAQLGDRRVLAVLAKSLAVTLALFGVFGVGVFLAVRWAAPSYAVGGWGAIVAVVAMALALWALFRAVAIAVVGVFADEVVAAVEARHYPAALKTARPVPLDETFPDWGDSR